MTSEHKDSASKSSNDSDIEVNNMLQNMSMENKKDVLVCANCGKEGDEINNVCNKCKQVKYCNAACKKKHRTKHKKHCERRVAELHDKELFKQPPPAEDCPICFLRMPTFHTGSTYKSCCGKLICSGCIHAPVYDDQGNIVDNEKCPFCRTPTANSYEEMIEWEKKRVEAGDPIAIYNLGCIYRDGTYGYPQDHTKALELFHQAGELGYTKAYNNIGYACNNGQGVEVDKRKAKHYYELAAMRGCEYARYNLGNGEEHTGNMNRALKHWMISARDGYAKSLEKIKELYSTNGHATKEDYTTALRLYQEYLGEIKSVQRDKAAAADESYQYY